MRRCDPLATATVTAELTGNGLNTPFRLAFDGERMLACHNIAGGGLSLWKAADLSPLGSVGLGSDTLPLGACSDGLNFWVALPGTDRLARF